MKKTFYRPLEEILARYANILVNFALNSGQGVRRGEVVFLQVPEAAKPLLIALNRTVLKASAHPIIQYVPNEMMKGFFQLANDEQIKFFPASFYRGRIRQADHMITILAETDKHELEGVDPRKIMERNKAFKPYYDWQDKKELAKKFTWTLGLYGTEAMAKEAKLTLEECWQQIIKACYLDFANPVKKWRQVQVEIERVKANLNKLAINKLHLESKGTDLVIGIGQNRKWAGGDGANIPSFEIFISPDFRLTEGKISFDFPLYRYGNLIKDIRLEFKKGKVSRVEAKKGENILREMIKVKGAKQIGEFSLTDVRLSRITKFMAETLYDENFGGRHGNVHIALGSSYKETYSGHEEISRIRKKKWQEMGFNNSVIHTDIISTEDRIVTAYLENGDKKVIYKNGRFTV